MSIIFHRSSIINEKRCCMTLKRLKIGALISGSGSNLRAIMDACEDDRIDGDVVFVGSDTPDVLGLTRAQKRNIPTFVMEYGSIDRNMTMHINDFAEWGLSPKQVADYMEKSRGIIPTSIKENDQRAAWLVRRFAAERKLLHEINQYEFDLLVLAGFMKIFTAFFIDQINTNPLKPLIMNVHPALLPAFAGTDGYGDTFNYGCKVGGSTVQFVDYGEDTGPIIDQIAISILPGESLKSFKKRGLEQEWILYPRCIQLFAEGRLEVVTGGNGRRIVKIS